MSNPDKGYLLIADITGYTRFLTGSELDHAKGILEQLFSALLARLKLPFTLSNVQGDAILAHAPAETVPDGHQVLDLVDALYCGFADALEQMRLNTTCTCAACRNIANLDLKLLVHYGTYVEQTIAGRAELQGADVILVHRLLKNSVTKSTGVRAYTAFTAAAIAGAGLTDYFDTLPHVTEDTDDFGEVTLGIVDMHAVWERYRAGRQVAVAADDPRAFPDIEAELPVPQARAWFLLTDPAMRRLWVPDMIGLERDGTERGRVTVGTVEHCAHGNGMVMVFRIVEWRPPETYTQHIALSADAYIPATLIVTPTPNGSRVTVRAGLLNTYSQEHVAEVRAQFAPMAEVGRQTWQLGFSTLVEIAQRDAAPVLPELTEGAIGELVRDTANRRLAAG